MEPNEKSTGLKKVLAGFALSRVNPEASYSQALKGRPKNVHPLTDAGFKKYLGLEHDESLFRKNPDGSVALPPKTEAQILVDTNKVKDRIATNSRQYESLIKQNPNHPTLGMLKAGRDNDKNYLEQLRHMYKTGEPIVVNEFDAWKDRRLIKDGKVIENPISPLNIMQNFTIKPNEKTGTIEYNDTYDLDKIPLVDRIFNPFKIKGTIPGAKYIKR